MSFSHAGLYTMPRHAHFLRELARALLADYASTPPEALAAVTIFLPNRRSVRELRTQFLQLNHGQPLLLPRMLTLADVKAEDLALIAGLDAASLPTPISATARQTVLLQLVQRHQPDLTAASAMALAAELGTLLTQLQIFNITADDLHKIDVADYSAHWQSTLGFLQLITKLWPQYLTATQQQDAMPLQQQLVAHLAQHWHTTPPAAPIIIAGFGRAEPAIIKLMQAILTLPQGTVLLPAFDHSLADDLWLGLDSLHPDFLLQELLLALGVTRQQVQSWPCVAPVPHARAELLQTSLWPAAAAQHWRHFKPQNPAALAADIGQNFMLLEAAHEQQEALAIASIIREALETPAQTISVITPNRNLARAVAAELKRWGVVADDSSGLPLLLSPLGIYVQQVLAAAQPTASVVDIAALFKALSAPLAAVLNESAANITTAIGLLERDVWRAELMPTGFAALQTITTQHAATELQQKICQHVFAQLVLLAALLTAPTPARFTDILQAHLQTADALQNHQLFIGAAAEAVVQHTQQLLLDDITLTLPAADYTAAFTHYFAGIAVRTPLGQHPRITIHGLIESRLQQADVIILAGLNEGVWPPAAPVSPYLSRAMHSTIGLPVAETVLAQTAHDFYTACLAPKVILTRALRAGGSPTMPARWLLRLQALLAPLGLYESFTKKSAAQCHMAYSMQLDAPAARAPLPQAPAFAPPITARPSVVSATSLELWRANPYAFYAKKILNLRALPPLAPTPNAMHKGTIWHKILEDFTRATQAVKALQPTHYNLLQQLAAAEFAALATSDESIAVEWQQEFIRALPFWWQQELLWRQTRSPYLLEQSGQTTLGALTLTARVDRIDQVADGTLAVLDYKTGALPSLKSIKQGKKLQLPVAALVAAAGGFAVPVAHAAELIYIKPNTANVKLFLPESKMIGAAEIPDLLAAFTSNITALAARYAVASMPYTAKYHDDDYAHLSRQAEWAFAIEEDDEVVDE